MKNFTFILLALLSGTVFAQSSASASTTANADIVSPLTIVQSSNMNFGKVVTDAFGGTVTLNPNGAPARSGSAQIITASDWSVGAFTVNATNNYAYLITLPSSVDLVNGSNEMTIDNFTHNMGATPKGTGSAQNLNVGGTLTVIGGQAEGNYTGTVNVTVAYQ